MCFSKWQGFIRQSSRWSCQASSATAPVTKCCFFLFGEHCGVAASQLLPSVCHLKLVPLTFCSSQAMNKPVNHAGCIYWMMKCCIPSTLPSNNSIILSEGKRKRVEDIYSYWFINTTYFPQASEEPRVDLVSARTGGRSSSGMPWPSSGGSVGAGWYPLTPALSLVGRGAVEYRAPQVMLHMACSLLRRIKCQLWNHLKDQRSVFLIRPEFWGSSFFFCFYCKYVLRCMYEIVDKMIHYYWYTDFHT